MRITIDIESKSEIEMLSALFKTFTSAKISFSENIPALVKGDKKIDPKSLFGIWANSPRSLEVIRKSAWERG